VTPLRGSRLRVGQRVIVPWAVSCGSCAHCLRGSDVEVRYHHEAHACRVRVRPGQRAVGRHDCRRGPRLAAPDPDQSEPLKAVTAQRELSCPRFALDGVADFSEQWFADLRAERVQ
jgi:hypothetical protein